MSTRRDELAQLDAALAVLQRAGVQWGAVRRVETELSWVKLRDGALEDNRRSLDAGYHVRVIDGGQGYAATQSLADLPRAAERAVALARAMAPLSYTERPFPPREGATGSWSAPCEIDPFSLSLEERTGPLRAASRAARAELGADDVVLTSTVALKVRSWHRDTEGAALFQEQRGTGFNLSATARSADGRFQRRSFPKAEEGNLLGRGWESVLAHDLEAEGARVAREARQLLDAPACPSGQFDIILDGAQLSLQIHESTGHPTEGDRVLGEEQSLAGGSFLSGTGTRYGSDQVHLYADARDEGAVGSFGWDDEGTPAGRVELVRAGEHVGYLTGRESAARLGVPNASAQRAQGWQNVAINRMTNVNLAPGSAGSLEQLIGSTEHGLLLSANKSWSIDQLRLDFQFGCEAAWEIRDGQLGQLYRDPVYSGSTPSFWGACDAICGPEEWQHWGWMYCGKGDPMQIMFVSHGCAPARFRGIDVEAR